MANVTINQLPLLPLEATDQLEIQRAGQSGASGKVTVQNILDLVPAPPGAVWGQITGTLSDQTDLQNALDAKAPSSAVSTATWGQIGGTLSAQTDLQNALNVKANAADVYTKAEADAAIAAAVANYLPLTGGSITGTLSVTGNISSNADVLAFQP